MTTSKFKTYYYLTKPGIIRGNAITAIGGFLLASRGDFNLAIFVPMLVGISLVIASACVVNNYIDRGLDAKMQRTRKRALVAGTVSNEHALIYATLLGFIGLVSLSFTNLLTFSLAIIGYIFYVVIYGYTKRRSSLGTVVGSVSGSIAIVVGYCSVTNAFDFGAILLFLIMVTWQMPHFYAISIYRRSDYRAAGIPVLSITRGIQTTKVYILLYIIAFSLVAMALSLFRYTGYIYLLVMLCLSLYWLRMAMLGFSTKDDIKWAKKIFGFSLIVLFVFSLLISVEVWLP